MGLGGISIWQLMIFGVFLLVVVLLFVGFKAFNKKKEKD